MPRFDLRDLFTKPRILIVTLNRGLLGPTAAELLGSLLVSQLWQQILARAAVPKDQRTPVSIILDEAQMFVRHESDLGEALEQSRSMGASWHLAHQHRAQMPPALLAGILANTRNKIQFQADPADAAAVTKHSVLAPDDLTKLPPFHIYVDQLAGGVQSGWFSAVTLPPPEAISDPDAIMAESRARYGRLPVNDESDAGADSDALVHQVLEGVLVDAPQVIETAAGEVSDEPIGRRRKATS